MKGPRLHQELLPITLGLALALGTIGVIKKVLMPVIGGTTARAEVFSLDSAVVLVLLAAFVLRETLEAAQTLLRLKEGKTVHISLHIGDVITLLAALVVSGLLYLGLIKYGLS